jgi:hypothetical protein
MLQLLIIAVVPSKSGNDVAALGAAPGQAYTPGGQISAGDPTGVTGTDGATTVTGGDPAIAGATTDAGGTVAGGGGTGGATGAAPGAAGAAGGGTAGDTSHCKGGRQFDPAVYAWAPPCVPKFTGDNGGSNGQRGVTDKEIKVVALRGNYGALVQQILEANGTPTFEQNARFLAAAEKFINANFELYGRKVVIKLVQLQCGTGGQGVPDDQCLRQEMRKIVASENPFAVVWITSVSSATFDELSQLKVVNLGGYGFTDTFNRNHRPYHWDVYMGGNQMASNIAEWWCKRMYGGGTAKAQYAGLNGADDMRNRVRRIGAISTNDPENRVIVSLLNSELKSKCGASIGAGNTYFYDQNIQTLQQQRTAAVAAMRQTTPDKAATDILCFCEEVAPQFLYKSMTDQGYYPENIVVGTGGNDTDKIAQSFDHGAEDAAQAPDRYPQYENAFGLAQFGKDEPLASGRGARMWKGGGGSGPVPYAGVDIDTDYYMLLGTLLQAAGPVLNAQNLEAGAFKLGPTAPAGGADERYPERGFGPGDYTWNNTYREVYWSPTRKSAFNNAPGTYVSLNGGRYFRSGQFPTGLLALPPKPRG